MGDCGAAGVAGRDKYAGLKEFEGLLCFGGVTRDPIVPVYGFLFGLVDQLLVKFPSRLDRM